MNLNITYGYTVKGKEKEKTLALPCSKKFHDDVWGKNGKAVQEMSHRIIDSIMSDIAAMNGTNRYMYHIERNGS